MSILDRLGLAPKRRQGLPNNIGENKKKEQEEAAYKKTVWIRVGIFLAFIALLVYFLPQTGFRYSVNYTVGEPWRADNLTAPFTYALMKSPAELEQERQAVRENTPPIFHADEEAYAESDAELQQIFDDLQPVLESWMQWRGALEQGSGTSEADSLRFFQELRDSPLELSDQSLELLLENYRSVRSDGRPTVQYVGHRLRNELQTLLSALLNNGMIDRSKETIQSEEITLRDLEQRTERNVSTDQIRDPEEAREYISRRLSQRFDSAATQTGMELFEKVVQPNWVYSEEDTEARLAEALDEISTTKGAVAQGQVIVRRGDIVTEETVNMLRSLAEARADTATTLERWLRFGGEVILLILASLFFLFYLYLYRKNIFENSAMFLLVFLVLGIIVLASGSTYSLDNISPYMVPVAIAPLILTIIFDSRVGLLATITLAIITAIFHDNHFEYLIATIMACSFGVYSVRDINKRTQFFVTTPFVVFMGYVLVIAGFSLTRFGGWESFMNHLIFISINSVFILFTYPLILFFEKTFNVTTDFTLLELADTNLPLLKELMNQAPGTFHHSLQVANMAESAASAIGANALLCRVGALYHDIGKMNKPGYFIENQTGYNEHDKLKPRMSALVIKAHVSDGIKMAREHDLPETLITFIRTHHGTSLIRYFYDKAQKNSTQEGEVREEDFRYDGPIPETRETGILLLADGVEAASRSMKDPTYSKLENLIQRMFDDHIQEGQLDRCPITFQELDIVKRTFLNILLGVYHSRIEYPDDDKKEGGSKKDGKKKQTSGSGDRKAKQKKSADSESSSEKPDQKAAKKPSPAEPAADSQHESENDSDNNPENDPKAN